MRNVAAGPDRPVDGGAGDGLDPLSSPAGVVVRRVRWKPAVRIVPSRFPTVDLFARVADPADFEAVIEVESMTNDRLRAESDGVGGLPERARVAGPGASYVMAAFTHVSPTGGRFTDGTYGAYYCARDHETAVRETVHHRERFMASTAEPPIDLEMRVIEADLDGRLHDIRDMRDRLPAVYDPGSYADSRIFALRTRQRGSNGIVYDSVRHEGGECAAVFRPALVRRARQGRHLLYRWDGERITAVLELTLRLP